MIHRNSTWDENHVTFSGDPPLSEATGAHAEERRPPVSAAPGCGRPRLIVTVAGVVVVALALWASGFYAGSHVSGAGRSHPAPALRDFMFEAIGVHTDNQGGQTINLYVHYRYNPGIAEHDIPNYVRMRKDALNYLATTDLSKNPFWETLNAHICAQLKTGYPVAGISCELQVVGNDTPGHSEPGYHASIETIGHIAPLDIPGPPTTR